MNYGYEELYLCCRKCDFEGSTALWMSLLVCMLKSVCVRARVHIYVCMYDVLGGGEGSDWLKAGDKREEGELTSLCSP